MSISNEQYSRMAKRASPNSPVVKNCIMAFLFGGSICAFAQGLTEWFTLVGMAEEDRKALVLVILILITAVLTAMGVFDNIAKHAGAGTMVPITGFANSVVSPAIEHRCEGSVPGTAAQMFSLAGPVIVYGCSTASLWGLIVYMLSLY